jgi:hypothetical protein
MARVYLHAWQVMIYEFFHTIAKVTLDQVIHKMLDPAEGFYSTQDPAAKVKGRVLCVDTGRDPGGPGRPGLPSARRGTGGRAQVPP